VETIAWERFGIEQVMLARNGLEAVSPTEGAKRAGCHPGRKNRPARQQLLNKVC